jgi:hypothetical protein
MLPYSLADGKTDDNKHEYSIEINHSQYSV